GHTDDTMTTKTNFEAHMPYTFDVWGVETLGTPDLATLQQYDLIFLYENGVSGQSEAVGNAVYSYFMDGGNVVIATFYWQDRGAGYFDNTGWGNLETVDPFVSALINGEYGNRYSETCVLDTASMMTHPLTDGITSLSVPTYCGGVTAKPEATVAAYWTNGDPAIGYTELGQCQRIVGVTMFPPMENYGGFTGDFYKAFENAISFANNDCNQIPELGSVLAVGVAVIGALAGFFLLRKRA
ncbi:MAG: hypothetical protein V1743_03645, partial [Nanoarchaeota archaeon]